MKILKPIFLSTFVALTISSCRAPAGMIGTDPANIDKTILKTTKITDKDLKRWSHLDLVKDTIPGMSLDKGAEFLKGRKSIKVIVAVIDSGIDIEHEDLKGSIWTNRKEIAGNKIDDDKNGFIDDINGWNFLGDVENEQLEITRIVKKGATNTQEYQIAKAKLDKKIADLAPQKEQLEMILGADKACAIYLKKKNYSIDEVKTIKTTDAALGQAKMIMSQVLASSTREAFDKEMLEYKNYVYDQLNYNLNLNHDGRKLLNNNPNDINTKIYGNNIVWGPKKEGSKHGTHVAGIIAQIKNNGLGGDGAATGNVEIMTIRAVPNGDEHDKDIANAIIYATDNGAKIINGSFGKDNSPNKQWVFDAIKYAESKDVLFVHAAGNDAKNIDVEPNFPNDADGSNPEYVNNMLTIGALNFEFGSKMIADFSNYGKTNVDIFAPGVKIYATTPNNTYEYLQGTSMAAPNVAGVASLIRAYFPTLTAAQVKKVILDSGTPIATTVTIGETTKTSTTLGEISKTGKIVNAYNALVLALKTAKK